MMGEIACDQVSEILGRLLDGPVGVRKADRVTDHPATRRALVADDGTLMGVLGADLPFAHRSGAALAMVPARVADEAGDRPDNDLIENYIEVANVLSRVVNEASSERVRIDPGLRFPDTVLDAVVAKGRCTGFEVDIDGYGQGRVALYLA